MSRCKFCGGPLYIKKFCYKSLTLIDKKQHLQSLQSFISDIAPSYEKFIDREIRAKKKCSKYVVKKCSGSFCQTCTQIVPNRIMNLKHKGKDKIRFRKRI